MRRYKILDGCVNKLASVIGHSHCRKMGRKCTRCGGHLLLLLLLGRSVMRKRDVLHLWGWRKHGGRLLLMRVLLLRGVSMLRMLGVGPKDAIVCMRRILMRVRGSGGKHLCRGLLLHKCSLLLLLLLICVVLREHGF